MKIKNVKMKKLLLLLTALILTFSTVFAQKKMNGQRIKALKTSYITNALNLTPKEAEKFWPVYNKFSIKIQSLKIALESGLIHEIEILGGVDALTEEDAQNFLNAILINEQQITSNKIKLIKELSKIISAKKIIKLKKTERDFNRRILQEYGKRRRLQGQ
tara:strand:+ start:9438 stop:9917 length:480 start_codon:yes stop_codon:yes gene_type:complete